MKRILALTLALAMTLSLAACGGKTTTTDTSTNKPSASVEKPVTENISKDETTTEEVKGAYLPAGFNTDGFTEITSMNQVRLQLPNEILENSVGYQEYMIASMLMLSLAFGGDISDSGMTVEDVQNILMHPMIMEMPDTFSYIDAVSPVTATVTVLDNADNLTIDDITIEKMTEILNVPAEEEYADIEDVEINIEAEVNPNSGISDEANTTEGTEASDTVDNVLLIAPAPEAEVKDTTENTGDAVDGVITDGAIMDDTITIDGATMYEAVDTSVKVVEEVARTEDKVVFKVESLMETYDEAGNQIIFEMDGFATIIISDGKVVAGVILYNSEVEGMEWTEQFIQSIRFDADALTTMTDEEINAFDDLFGFGGTDEETTEIEVESTVTTDGSTDNS